MGRKCSPITCIKLTQHGKKMSSTNHKTTCGDLCRSRAESKTFVSRVVSRAESKTLFKSYTMCFRWHLMTGGEHFLPMLSERNACDGRAK